MIRVWDDGSSTIFDRRGRTRMRAQAILQLSQGRTLQQTADEFGVHLNNVEHWRHQWNHDGLAGLYEGRRTGPSWDR